MDPVPGEAADFLHTSDVAMVVVDLPDARILDVNAPGEVFLDAGRAALLGAAFTDYVAPEQRGQSAVVLRALADGALTGYQAVRNLRPPGCADREFSVWVSALDVGGARRGLVSFVPVHGAAGAPLPVTAGLDMAGSTHAIVARIDSEWRIDRASKDVEELLGFTIVELRGSSILAHVHPDDTPSLEAAAECAQSSKRTVRADLRLRAKDGRWVSCTVLLAALDDVVPPALAFVAMPVGREGAAGEAPGSSLPDLEQMMRDLRVAHLVPRLAGLPSAAQLPELAELTGREMEVLVRFGEGERVALIAEDLYVSQSTVRNHLSSIFGKLGVRSQTELVRLLRSEGPHADG